MALKYKIIITKETIVELASENEAKQIADMIVTREVSGPSFGGVSYVFSDYEVLAS